MRLPPSRRTFLPVEVITDPCVAFDVSELSCRFFSPMTPDELLFKAFAADTLPPAALPTAPVVAPAVEPNVEPAPPTTFPAVFPTAPVVLPTVLVTPPNAPPPAFPEPEAEPPAVAPPIGVEAIVSSDMDEAADATGAAKA